MEQIRVVGTVPDVVQVMRTWTIEGAPDWTPPYKRRAIVPTTVKAVWIDGKIDRIAVHGPYRMKDGSVAKPKFDRDESHIGGTGNSDYRHDWDRMEFVRAEADGTWSGFYADKFPSWMEAFIAAHQPATTQE